MTLQFDDALRQKLADMAYDYGIAYANGNETDWRKLVDEITDEIRCANFGAENCVVCHYRLPKQRKEILNGQKFVMLRRAAGHVMSTMVNDFKVSDFTEPADFKAYNFFSHLRLHGLIAKVKVDGKVQRGRWLITRNGWRFLRGQIELPEYLLVRNNKIQSRSETTVSVYDVMRGDTAIVTSFDYFDDYGQPVGHYPSADGNQSRLL